MRSYDNVLHPGMSADMVPMEMILPPGVETQEGAMVQLRIIVDFFTTNVRFNCFFVGPFVVWSLSMNVLPHDDLLFSMHSLSSVLSQHFFRNCFNIIIIIIIIMCTLHHHHYKCVSWLVDVSGGMYMYVRFHVPCLVRS